MSYKYVDNIADIILDRVDIVQIISQYVSLVRAGRNFKSTCPFHSEKTPSFIVSPDKQIYTCFGCGKKGNAIRFIMDQENLNFIDAIEVIAERNGIDLEPYRIQKKSTQFSTKPFYELNRQAGISYIRNLRSNEVAMNYLKNRGLKDETIKEFGLGYSLDSWRGLFDLIGKRDSDLIEKSGLFIKNNSGNYYDRFRARIMFPIIDQRNRVIGFGARDIKGEEPKYLNSPDTPVFYKSNHLYGLNIAKQYREEGFYFLVEGYMDVIALNNFGIKNVVASLGTSLTENQADLISKYVKKVVVLYDADSAGEKATLRALDILKNTDMTISVVRLNEGLDPDEFLKKYGVEEFRNYIKKNQVNYLYYIAKNLIAQYDLENNTEKLEAYNKAVDFVNSFKDVKNRILVSNYFVELNVISEFERNQLFSINDVERGIPKQVRKEQSIRKRKILTLLNLVLSNNKIAEEIVKDIYYDYLPEFFINFINYLILNDFKVNFENLSEEFSIDELNLIDESKKVDINSNIAQNWKFEYYSFLKDYLDKVIKELDIEDDAERVSKKAELLSVLTDIEKKIKSH